MSRKASKLRWILLLLGVLLGTQRAAAATLFQNSGPTVSNPQFAIADFDGDSKPDVATVDVAEVNSRSARYAIRINFASGIREFVGVSAAFGGLQIVPRDVNGDFAPDLIVSSALMHEPVAVLLNDGHGNFTAEPPSAFASAVPAHPAGLRLHAAQTLDRSALLWSKLFHGDDQQRKSLDLPRYLPQPVCLASFLRLSSRPHQLLSSRAPPLSAL